MKTELSGQCGIDFKCCQESYQPCKYYEDDYKVCKHSKLSFTLMRICTNDFAKRDALIDHLKQYENLTESDK